MVGVFLIGDQFVALGSCVLFSGRRQRRLSRR
jgi:hypothetical protein